MSAVRRMDTAPRRGDSPPGRRRDLDAADTGIRIHVSVPGEALLPVIASEHLHQGSGGYGLLLAALGAGAVGGALGMGRLRKALTANQLLLFSGCSTAVASWSPPRPRACPSSPTCPSRPGLAGWSPRRHSTPPCN
ncbi:MFS transporter [Streptomyces mirabilis]|uniref:MFS transporter n=1 Tax=Streptomyces mirabilis TaxID=68239 RepID=UPI0035715DA1